MVALFEIVQYSEHFLKIACLDCKELSCYSQSWAIYSVATSFFVIQILHYYLNVSQCKYYLDRTKQSLSSIPHGGLSDTESGFFLQSYHWSSPWSQLSWQWCWQSGWRLMLQSISLVLRWSLLPLKLGSIGPRPHWQHWQSIALTICTCKCTPQSTSKLSYSKIVFFASNF